MLGDCEDFLWRNFTAEEYTAEFEYTLGLLKKAAETGRRDLVGDAHAQFRLYLACHGLIDRCKIQAPAFTPPAEELAEPDFLLR